jgi:hypothetical protein
MQMMGMVKLRGLNDPTLTPASPKSEKTDLGEVSGTCTWRKYR